MILELLLTLSVFWIFWAIYRRPRPRRWLIPYRPGAVAYPGARTLEAHAALPAKFTAKRDYPHKRMSRSSEMAFERTRSRFRDLLAIGRTSEIERILTNGDDFSTQVRALVDIGSPVAGDLLIELLDRSITNNSDVQLGYWANIISALRKLNRTEALPRVLRCASRDLHQGVQLAAEALLFPNFYAVLLNLESPIGKQALICLIKASSGVRAGVVDAASMIRAGLADHLACVVLARSVDPDPLVMLAVIEAERIHRRIIHWANILTPEDRFLARRQEAHLAASAKQRQLWLKESSHLLLRSFGSSRSESRQLALRCFEELHIDVGELFLHPRLPRNKEGIGILRCLRWSKGENLGEQLASLASRNVGSRKARDRVALLLDSLRGHACREAEMVLLESSRCVDPLIRAAGVGALGWWEPFQPDEVIEALKSGRTDPEIRVRRAATMALARFGERSALDSLTEAFAAEEPMIRRTALMAAADERISWLWPEIDAMIDYTHLDTAFAACEANEHLREQVFGLLD